MEGHTGTGSRKGHFEVYCLGVDGQGGGHGLQGDKVGEALGTRPLLGGAQSVPGLQGCQLGGLAGSQPRSRSSHWLDTIVLSVVGTTVRVLGTAVPRALRRAGRWGLGPHTGRRI